MNSDDLHSHPGWSALVEAERQVHMRRAEILRAEERTELLAAAMASSSNWDQGAALLFLRQFPDDVPTLLPSLVALSLSQRWIGLVMEVIRTSHTRNEMIMNALRDLIRSNIAALTDDSYYADYFGLANLIRNIDAEDLLAELAAQAHQSSDPEIREEFAHYLEEE
ncbi:hypothetical protein [Actinoallomurus sp. NPDC050550]|uniref:hypothetical protein n=1 Tax=Actinoallomurus sp. NPDC050550 TaxID=3154937 RepID=UPI0033FEB7D3